MPGKLGNETAGKIESTTNANALRLDLYITRADGKFPLDLSLYNQLFQLKWFQPNHIL